MGLPTKGMSKPLAYFRFLILVVCSLSVGCADFFPMERSGVIQIRLPADQTMPNGVQFVEAILKAHQFSKLPAQAGREESNTTTALQLMTTPGSIQPVTMPQELRSTWRLSIDHRGATPDTVACSIYPTEGSNLLQVSVRVEYVGHTPILVTQFWKDLVWSITQRYGSDRVSINANL